MTQPWIFRNCNILLLVSVNDIIVWRWRRRNSGWTRFRSIIPGFYFTWKGHLPKMKRGKEWGVAATDKKILAGKKGLCVYKKRKKGIWVKPASWVGRQKKKSFFNCFGVCGNSLVPECFFFGPRRWEKRQCGTMWTLAFSSRQLRWQKVLPNSQIKCALAL